MHPSLRLRGWNALHTVHPAFKFQPPKHAFPFQPNHSFLEAAHRAFTHAHPGVLPTARLRVFEVHAQQVSCEQRRLVSSRARPHFQNGVPVIRSVVRKEHPFGLLYPLLKKSCQAGELRGPHSLHVWIVRRRPLGRFVPIGQGLDKLLGFVGHGLQPAVLHHECRELFLIGGHVRIGHTLLDLGKAVGYAL